MKTTDGKEVPVIGEMSETIGDLLKSNAYMDETGTYYFLPFGFRDIGDGKYELLDINNGNIYLLFCEYLRNKYKITNDNTTTTA